MNLPNTDASARAGLEQRALRLEYATIAWNIGEAFFTIGLGSIAGSLALIGFGTVSVVEVFASAVVIWHIRGDSAERTAAQIRRTRTALRLISVSFGVLGAIIAIAAINDLTSGRRADESLPGIVYLAVTAVVMFGLAVLKRRTAVGLSSEPLHSEATVTFIDGVLSTSTLIGLALNAFTGLWWGDPAAGLVVAVAALNEARESWEEAGEVAAR